jgi:hypothetical protein
MSAGHFPPGGQSLYVIVTSVLGNGRIVGDGLRPWDDPALLDPMQPAAASAIMAMAAKRGMSL